MGGTAGEGEPDPLLGRLEPAFPECPYCPDGESAARRLSLGVRLHPLAEATGVASRADGRESPAGVAQRLPQVFQPLAEPVNSGEVHEAQEIALLRPVQDVKGVGGVG